MAKKKISFSNFVKTFLQITEFDKTGHLIPILNTISLILYFTHMLSYIFKFQWNFEDDKLNFLSGVIFYSFFPNLLLYFNNRTITLLSYIVSLIFIMFYLLYVVILTLFIQKIKRISIIMKFCKIANQFYAFSFRLYFCILLLPSLEMFINPLFCDLDGSYLSCDDKFGIPFIILSVFGIIIAICLGLLCFVVYQSYAFLDLNSMKFHSNVFTFICFVLRSLLPLLFPFFGKNIPIVYYIFLFIISFLLLLDYWESFTIRTPSLSEFYVSCLFLFLTLLFIMTFCEFSNILIEQSVFILFLLLAILTGKLGVCFFYRKYYKLISCNFAIKGFVDFSLEELKLLFETQKFSSKNHFYLVGMLKAHSKNCKDPKCKFREKQMQKYEKMSFLSQELKIKSFITQKLCEEIENEKKNNNFKQMETMMLKYVSFLIGSGLNSSKSLYEVMRVIAIFSKRSYVSTIIFEILLKKAHGKILEIEQERKLMINKYEDDKSLETTTFFKIHKQKLSFEGKMKKLLQAKIGFWERYKEGLNSYEEIIADLYKLVKVMFIFEKKLEKSMQVTNKENLITLKFSSIFYCIIMNHLQQANKVEDEIENLKKRYIRIKRDCLSPLSFLEDDLVTCEASFLNNLDGVILENSKNDKMAKFFGYDLEEIKMIKSVTEFMPNLFGIRHKAFLNWSFSKTRKDMVASKSQVLTYAIDKEGFLFPIKLFFGNSLGYTNDFVIHAAIMKLNINENECLLFQRNGLMVGCTDNFLHIFNEMDDVFTLKNLKLLNVYSFIPKIKDFIDINNAFEQETNLVLRNLNATILIPSNIKEILEVLQFKYDDFMTNERNKHSMGTSFYSYNTINSSRSKNTANSKRSEKSNATAKLNSFFSKYNKTFKTGNLFSKKDFLLKVLHGEQDESNRITIDGLLDLNKVTKRRLNFDLSFKAYKYGKLKDECVLVCWMKVNNVGIIEQDTLTNVEKEKDEFFSSSDMTIKGIEMPKENVAQFGFEFEREIGNTSFFSDDKRTMRDKLQLMEEQKKSERNEFETKNNLEKNEKSEKKEKSSKINDKSFEKTNTIKNKDKETTNIENLTYTELSIEKNKDAIQFFSLKNDGTLPPPGKKPNYTLPNLVSLVKPDEKKSCVKLSVNSSKSKENERLRLQELKGETTEKGNMVANLDKKSQKESSVTTSKKSYAIFNTVKSIQTKLPMSVFFIIASLLLQIILIICYCLIIYFFATSYISSSYTPLQNYAIDQCRINIGIDISALIINEYEYDSDGYGSLTAFQKAELQRIMIRIYNISKDLFYLDRNTKSSFSSTSYLTDLYVPYADFLNPSESETILFTDLTDRFLEVINTFVTIQDYKTIADYIKVLARNFPSYAIAAKSVRDGIQAEFVGSIDITSNNVILVMALMMAFVSVCKVFEMFMFSSYYLKITKLVNIFLRISPKEALNELTLNKDILNILQNPAQSYLHYYYPDKYLNRKDFTIDNEELEMLQAKKLLRKSKKTGAVSKVKRTSLFNLRSISKNRVYIFIFITLTIGIGYFFSNYYFWSITAQNVSNLLQVNSMFINLYIYSTTDICYLNFLIREKIYSDPEYAKNPETYQNHQTRLNYFYSDFSNRLTLLESYVATLPNYAIPAQGVIQDPSYDTLVKGDACQNLIQAGTITIDLLAFCDSLLNGASESGLMSIVNEYIKSLTQNPLGDLINESNATLVQKQNSDLQSYLWDTGRSENVIQAFYLTEMLYIFYNFLNNYYMNILNQQVLNLEMFIWITCISFSMIMMGMVVMTWIYLTMVYRHVSFSMALIPYEKLANDEQTIFLIKQFWKEHS